eukprot:CAMPEP_0116958194 /NCGR_PEP_ID=MMETSP0467-20121206/44473_1 /TAXON_ID=283647 /ORGANISM="Mesodinium pulex, Strain SPMC105" /LENGTH=107 /DNA_ID=CAMNT_0004645191 /DNA_START=218 /DNA_END=541 /DNA_ORIENTATION=+
MDCIIRYRDLIDYSALDVSQGSFEACSANSLVLLKIIYKFAHKIFNNPEIIVEYNANIQKKHNQLFSDENKFESGSGTGSNQDYNYDKENDNDNDNDNDNENDNDKE